MTHHGALLLACVTMCAPLWLLSRKWCLPHAASVPVILCSGIGGFFVGSLALMVGLAAAVGIAAGVVCQGALFLGILLWRFYRDPERTSAATSRGIVAPADGRIIYIKRVPAASQLRGRKGGQEVLFDELTQTFAGKGDVWLIGTSMAFTDVHVNRAPIEGTVTLRQRVPGGFLSLKVPEARSLNERSSTIISKGPLDVAVVQIASRLVRRIVSYVDVGQAVTQGQRIGMIRFGSQVDLAIPILSDMVLVVNVGDRVVAGETVVCSWEGTNG